MSKRSEEREPISKRITLAFCKIFHDAGRSRALLYDLHTLFAIQFKFFLSITSQRYVANCIASNRSHFFVTRLRSSSKRSFSSSILFLSDSWRCKA